MVCNNHISQFYDASLSCLELEIFLRRSQCFILHFMQCLQFLQHLNVFGTCLKTVSTPPKKPWLMYFHCLQVVNLNVRWNNILVPYIMGFLKPYTSIHFSVFLTKPILDVCWLFIWHIYSVLFGAWNLLSSWAAWTFG